MIMTRERSAKSQIGYQIAQNPGPYVQGDGDINFANGQLILIRMPTILPRQSTIRSAKLRVTSYVKNGGTSQQSIHRLYMHDSGDSPMLVPGRNEWNARPMTNSYVQWTSTWVANEQNSQPNGTVYRYIDVTSLLQQLVNKSDWTHGGYITFMLLCLDEQGSDMGIRANNDFIPTPQLVVDYDEPRLGERVSFNMCENSEFGTAIQQVGTDGNTVPYWFQGNFYGAFVDPENYGTMVRDTSFTRVPGIPTLRFTCAAPPTDTNKRTGPTYTLRDDVDYSTIFSGWIYVPAGVGITTTDDMFLGDPFRGGAGVTVSKRGAWVPFSTRPDPIPGAGFNGRYFAVGLRNFQAGQQFWLSEPTFVRSDFPQMPFNGLSAPREPGILHKSTVTNMASYRVWTPRRNLKLSDPTPRPYPSWRLREDAGGIYELAEPVRGYRPISELPGTIESLPSTSISEL